MESDARSPLNPHRGPSKDEQFARQKNRYRGCLICNVVFAIIFLAAAISGPFIVDSFVKDALEKNARLFNADQESFDAWADTSIRGMKYEIYVFNVTNPDDFVAGADLHVEPIGPFVYNAFNKRINIEFEQDDEIVSYYMWQESQFLPDESVDTEDLLLTTIDPVYAVIVGIAAGSGFMRELYGFPNDTSNIDVNRIFMQRPVRDIAYGYDDPVTEPLRYLGIPWGFPGVMETWNLSFATTGRQRDYLYTGKSDINDARKYYLFQNDTEYKSMQGFPFYMPQPTWDSDEANQVRGYDPYQFPPGVVDEEYVVEAFIPPMFRRVQFTFNGQRPVHLGVESMRFTVDQDLTFTPAYYNDPEKPGYFWNVSAATFEGPTYLFNPHMLDCPEGMDDNIVGLTPDQALHETFIDIEPRSGATINARIGFQGNLGVSGKFFVVGDFDLPELRNYTWHDDVKPTYAPLFSAQVVGAITPELADWVNSNFALADGAKIGMPIAFGVLCFLCLCATVWYYRKNKENNRQIAVATRNRLLGDLM